MTNELVHNYIAFNFTEKYEGRGRIPGAWNSSSIEESNFREISASASGLPTLARDCQY